MKETKDFTDAELDAAIATEVLGGAELSGFRCPKCGGGFFGSSLGPAPDFPLIARHCHNEYGRGCHWHGPAIECVPNYSADIDYAWGVVDKMRTDGYWWAVAACRAVKAAQ